MGKDFERGKYTSPEGSRTWEYLSAIFCAVGTFCIGNVVGWNLPSLNKLQVPNSRISMTIEEASTLAGCLSTGNILAFPLSFFVVDRVGRRNSMLVSILGIIINWSMILVAEDVLVLMLARFTAGISMGMIMITCPIYIVEVLSANIRGSLGALGGITYYTGVLFMFGVAPHLGVQATARFCMGFAMVFLICFWFVPESPYFLVMVGRVDEAKSALEKLRGKTDVADDFDLIEATFREKGKFVLITDESREEVNAKKPSASKRVFATPGNLKSFLIGIILMTLQHFCGFQMILYYCHMIMKDMGSGLDEYVAAIIFSALQAVSATLTVFLVDRVGCKPLLLNSGVITSFLLLIIATYFYLMEHMDMEVKQYSMVPLYSIFGLAVAMNMGVMGVPGTVQAEIYATDVKLLANCIVGLSGGVMAFITTQSYLLIATTWGFGHSVPFFGFAIVTFFCTVILMRWLPETKSKTLLEIQRELNTESL